MTEKLPSEAVDASTFSEKGYWKKLKSVFQTAGEKAVFSSLVLYYTAKAEETPLWAKTVVMGTLGYFISLVDVIPDLTPILGYTDDVSLMIAALGAIAAHITPEIKHHAQTRTEAFFGKPLESNIIDSVKEPEND